MPLCLPLLVIATLHTGVIDDAPLLCAAMRHLLNRELCHRKLGTYTKRREELPKINSRSRFRYCTLDAPETRSVTAT